MGDFAQLFKYKHMSNKKEDQEGQQQEQGAGQPQQGGQVQGEPQTNTFEDFRSTPDQQEQGVAPKQATQDEDGGAKGTSQEGQEQSGEQQRGEGQQGGDFRKQSLAAQTFQTRSGGGIIGNH